MNNKKSFVEPKDAPVGTPCRFCDIPANMEGKGGVYRDGTALDGSRPLFSHVDCLMESGGLKQDNQDFSLQSLLPKDLLSPYRNEELINAKPELAREASAEDDVWAFATKYRYSHEEPNGLTDAIKPEEENKIEPMLQTTTKEQYAKDGTGAPIPPSV